MERKLAGLLGAVVSLGALTTAQAAPAPADVLQANSYAELLEPIANASMKLNALDEMQTADEGTIQLARYHHHHHHHRGPRLRFGPIVVGPRHHRHHHHHHHYRHHHHHHYRR